MGYNVQITEALLSFFPVTKSNGRNLEADVADRSIAFAC
jgi:hypothetical protein